MNAHCRLKEVHRFLLGVHFFGLGGVVWLVLICSGVNYAARLFR